MGALVESEPLDEGQPALGSRFHDVFEEHGRRIELEAELVEFDPPRAQTVKLTGSAFEATSAQRLESVDGGTRLTAVIETRYTALAARLAAALITRHAQSRLEADLATLKDLVERER
jgi:carbon monoxide dehydrogenase subunit G